MIFEGERNDDFFDPRGLLANFSFYWLPPSTAVNLHQDPSINIF